MRAGAVVAGVIGYARFAYDLWGNTVNIAGRMESSGLPNKIRVTESFYNSLSFKTGFLEYNRVSVKGLGEMTTYLYNA